MNYDNDDALDAALFSLELEEPPAELRASILAATVYRPQPMFSRAEIFGLAGLAAAILTLVALVVGSGGTLFAPAVSVIVVFLNRTFTNIATLDWMAAGGAVAIWLSLFTGFQSFAMAPSKAPKAPHR